MLPRVRPLATNIRFVAAVSAAAAAVITTFTTFSASGGSNVRIVNSGTSANRANDAVYYTTSTPTDTAPGAVQGGFSFINTALAPFVSTVNALYTLNATVAKNSPAGVFHTTAIQSGISGTFSFISTSAIVVSGPGFATTVYAAGSNLLSGSFSGSSLVTTLSASAGATFASGLNGTNLAFTSDFLNFGANATLDRSTSLSAISPVAGIAANGALRSFRAVTGGQNSADPAPLPTSLTAVPEPATWALLVIGFGLVGVAKRRRTTAVAA